MILSPIYSESRDFQTIGVMIMMTIQTVIRTAKGYRGAVARNGLVVAVSVNAWTNPDPALMDAYKLSRVV
jgi:hypothetical protein